MIGITLSVYRRPHRTGDERSVSQGLITVAPRDVLPFQRFAAAGSVRHGIVIRFDDAIRPGENSATYSRMGHPNSPLGRLQLRENVVDLDVPLHRKAAVGLEVEAPVHGVWRLPPLAVDQFRWADAMPKPPPKQRAPIAPATLAHPEPHVLHAVDDDDAPARRKVGRPRKTPPVMEPVVMEEAEYPLLDLCDYADALRYVNEGIATGVFEVRLKPDRTVWIGLRSTTGRR